MDSLFFAIRTKNIAYNEEHSNSEPQTTGQLPCSSFFIFSMKGNHAQSY